ncbi:MAG: hypothetical protein ACNYNY_01140 [Candidatus Oxydemutatoraceae bacterium WSBS_2016_MAG_OTU14]
MKKLNAVGDPLTLVTNPQRLQTLTVWKERYANLEDIIALAYR